jgi:hypothetical protein
MNMSNDQNKSSEQPIKTKLPEPAIEEVPAADLDEVAGGRMPEMECTVTCDKTSL